MHLSKPMSQSRLGEYRLESRETAIMIMAMSVLACGALAQPSPKQRADSPPAARADGILAKPGLFKQLTEPPCSYCSTQNRKGLVQPGDRVIAWVRAVHNGGAIPIRHFLAAPRVINDTYGLFFYDPDGGYVSAFKKDYGYEFYGWRRGVMVVKGRDGSLWSALTGTAISGPSKGKKLERIASMMTDWGYWLMLHPESTAYDLYDGKRYHVAALPTKIAPEALATMGKVDPRLKPLDLVVGIEAGGRHKAYPLGGLKERACFMDTVGGERVAVLWYGPTRTAVAYSARLDERTLNLYADDVSPETAPFKDRETGTRWTIAGRGVDGPLRGRELTWVDSVQARWYAWAAERPGTLVYTPPLNGAMLTPDAATTGRLAELKAGGANALVLSLDSNPPAGDVRQAAARAERAGIALYYWIEVARNAHMAGVHPEWMASLQGHPEWRRLFPSAPIPQSGEVIKNYPWVPMLYQQTFDAHLTRIGALLKGLPAARGVFLNDLQAAPSACGCGNSLCRWTTDYGPILTATRLGDDAAARFVARVRQLAPRSPDFEVIPVWTSECEEHDQPKGAECDGVGCYGGTCWYAAVRQLMPIAGQAERIGALLPYRAFHRTDSRYGAEAGWVNAAIESFSKMPPLRNGKPVGSSRIVAILQGWEVTAAQRQAQIERSNDAGAGGWVMAYTPIEQSWEPRLVKVNHPLPAGDSQQPSHHIHAPTAH